MLTAGTASSAFERVLSSAPSGDADPLAAAEIDSNGAASEPHIDLLLCDIGLPDMSGWELMRQLRRRRPHILGLALSGFASDDDARRSRDAGFLGHLPKPVDLPKLESVLRSIAMAITARAWPAGPPCGLDGRTTRVEIEVNIDASVQ